MSFTGLNRRHEIELSRRCADSCDFYSSFNGCWRWGVGDAMLCAREEDFGGSLFGLAMESLKSENRNWPSDVEWLARMRRGSEPTSRLK
jgi:hypothetical protein